MNSSKVILASAMALLWSLSAKAATTQRFECELRDSSNVSYATDGNEQMIVRQGDEVSDMTPVLMSFPVGQGRYTVVISPELSSLFPARVRDYEIKLFYFSTGPIGHASTLLGANVKTRLTLSATGLPGHATLTCSKK
jgi:hypothetical protein